MGKEDRRRHFTREFKRNAVHLVTEKGMPVGEVARDLDIHPNLLHLWRRRLLEDGEKGVCGERPFKSGGSGDKAASEGIGEGEGREGHFKKSLGRILQTQQYQELLRDLLKFKEVFIPILKKLIK